MVILYEALASKPLKHRYFRYKSGVVWVHLCLRRKKKQLQENADFHLWLVSMQSNPGSFPHKRMWFREQHRGHCEQNDLSIRPVQSNCFLLYNPISLTAWPQALKEMSSNSKTTRKTSLHRLIESELNHMLMKEQTGLVWSVQWGRSAW